jgi:hypothetical protein
MIRSREAIVAAVLRLNQEELVPLEEIAHELFITKESIKRWGTRGRSGVFLDVVHQVRKGWMTSRPAMARFVRASDILADLPQPSPQEPLISFTTLAKEIGVDVAQLVVWATVGINGIVFKATSTGPTGWFASRESAERFLVATEGIATQAA